VRFFSIIISDKTNRSEDGGFICLADHAFEVEKTVEDSRSSY